MPRVEDYVFAQGGRAAFPTHNIGLSHSDNADRHAASQFISTAWETLAASLLRMSNRTPANANDQRTGYVVAVELGPEMSNRREPGDITKPCVDR